MLRIGTAPLFAIILLFFITSLMGCAVHRTGAVHRTAKQLIIPKRCVGIDIQSFTQPCVQQTDGKIVCNGVVIKANCVAVR